jgi:hypothetical protein
MSAPSWIPRSGIGSTTVRIGVRSAESSSFASGSVGCCGIEGEMTMNAEERIRAAMSHLKMLETKSADDPRALAMRALICHFRHGRPSLSTLLAVAQECGVAGFEMFKGLEETT